MQNTSCKIIHATHAKLGATKAKQSRRNCEIKQMLYEQLLYFVTEKHKINFMVAPQQIIKTKKKTQRSGVLHILHRKKNCQFLQYGRHWAEFGVLCLE